MIHPAHRMQFSELKQKLQDYVKLGLVSEKSSDDLKLYCYTQKCTYEKKWDEITTIARGLIINDTKIVASSFPKFFNYGEQDIPLPNIQFEVFDKMDGSLIIIFNYNGKWRCATKGSFNSEQAQWAQKIVDNLDMFVFLDTTTILAEAIYPENKIVVNYPYKGLVFLSAYNANGVEVDYNTLKTLVDCLPSTDTPENIIIKTTARKQFTSFTDVIDHVKTLSSNEEGFVIRYANGYRIKLKGEEYLRIHRMISQVTPLAIWNLMLHDCKLEDYRKELPEEFWADFDNICSILYTKLDGLCTEIQVSANCYKSLTNKELGLIPGIEKTFKGLLFSYRQDPENFLRVKLGKTGEIIPCPRLTIFNIIKPKANVLDGYVPSRYLENVNDE